MDLLRMKTLDALSVEPGFISALPVWPEGEAETLNAFFAFRCCFTAHAGDSVLLRATAAYDYKAWLNGGFAGFGPVRCSPGFFRVDTWPLAVQEGENVLEVQLRKLLSARSASLPPG